MSEKGMVNSAGRPYDMNGEGVRILNKYAPLTNEKFTSAVQNYKPFMGEEIVISPRGEALGEGNWAKLDRFVGQPYTPESVRALRATSMTLYAVNVWGFALTMWDGMEYKKRAEEGSIGVIEGPMVFTDLFGSFNVQRPGIADRLWDWVKDADVTSWKKTYLNGPYKGQQFPMPVQEVDRIKAEHNRRYKQDLRELREQYEAEKRLMFKSHEPDA